MDAAAASVLRPHGRLGWEHNLGEEWDASSPSRRSSGAPEDLVLVVCWVHLLTLLGPHSDLSGAPQTHARALDSQRDVCPGARLASFQAS